MSNYFTMLASVLFCDMHGEDSLRISHMVTEHGDDCTVGAFLVVLATDNLCERD